MSIEIKRVTSRSDRLKFVKFPLKLYKNNPYYVPALIFDELNTFNTKKNPSFDFCEADCFLALRNGEVVGRIAAILNRDVNAFWNQEHARFGWLDVIDDIDVTKALISTVEEWAKERGMKAIKGPLGFCDLDPEGMLVHGFDQPGTFATIYNHPYYPEHMEKLGFTKEVDWKEFLIGIPSELSDRYTRMADILAKKYDLQMAKLTSNKQLVKQYGQKIFKLWNETYNVLYGYAPLTKRQEKYYINMYLSMINIDLVSLIVDKNDDVIGFGISMPSLSKALQKNKGRLFPFGFLHLLKALRKNDTVDLYLMGIRLDYQQKGLIALIIADLAPKYVKRGYRFAESNPELEHNGKIQATWADFNPRHHKTRRVFIRDI